MPNEVFLNADDSIAQTVVDFGTVFEPTVISGGGITFATSAIEIDTEDSDPTDDLDIIANGGTLKSILMRSASADRVVTVKHATGNILTLDGATDIELDDPNKLLWLVYNGSYWIAMALGGGGAVTEGCVRFDFLLDDYGFTTAGGAWLIGVGWSTDGSGSPPDNDFEITLSSFASTYIVSVSIEMELGGSSISRTVRFVSNSNTETHSGTDVQEIVHGAPRTSLIFGLENNTNSGTVTITAVEVRFLGADPFTGYSPEACL